MASEKIIQIFCEIVGRDEDEVTEKTAFTQEYEIEPIDVARLVIACEKKFKIRIYDEGVASLKNIGDFIDYVEMKLAEK